MSNRRKIASKRQHRTELRRKRRKVIVDFETCSPMELGTRLHQEIEHVIRDGQIDYTAIEQRILGHYHAGSGEPMLNAQIMAYAYGTGLNEVMIVHGGTHSTDSYDLTKAEEIMAKTIRKIEATPEPRASMGWETLRDPRRDPLTGRIMPSVTDDDEDEG